MVKLTYDVVRDWLEQHGAACTVEQLHDLEGLVLVAEDQAKRREALSRDALAKANAAALAAGFTSLEELLRVTNPALAQQMARATHGSGRQPATPRKPYMDPLDPQSGVFALARHHPKPDWVNKRLAEGWKLEELHYKRHAAALSARGIEPKYNAIERHKALMEQEPPRYRR